MKTIGNIIHNKKIPLTFCNYNGNIIYYEDLRFWRKSTFDANGNLNYYEDLRGYVEDIRK